MKTGAIDADWQRVMDFFKRNFTSGEEPSLDTVLFLIGVQELGKGFLDFSRDDKLNLMHIGVCSILEPYGYYRKTEVDKDGWPHYELRKALPPMDDKETELFYKKAVIDYFKRQDLI